jgi:hypothetical protein
MQEEARQAAAAEQRSLAARQLSEQARQAELKRAEERLERLRSGVDWRWEQLIVRAKQDAERTSRNALLLLSFNIAITAVFVFGFTALAVFEFSGPDIPGKRHIFDTSFFIPAGVIGSLLYCFWAFHFLVVRVAARRARRAFLGLERERANFEAGVGVYAGPEDEASIRRFAAQIEMIVADEVAKTVPSQPAPERQISLSIESPTTSTQITGVADTVTVSSATPVAPAPPAALDNVSDKASAPLVPADVVIWYQPAPLITEWIAQFKLLFQALLGDVLGREPILWDITGSEAAAALRKAGAAKQHRPVSLVIVTRRLLSSEWMGSFARDLNLEGGPGAPPIIPITLDRTALSEIKELARYLSIDFSDLLYVGEAFTKSERYLDFQDRIRRVAASVAELLQQDGPYA